MGPGNLSPIHEVQDVGSCTSIVSAGQVGNTGTKEEQSEWQAVRAHVVKLQAAAFVKQLLVGNAAKPSARTCVEEENSGGGKKGGKKRGRRHRQEGWSEGIEH